MKSEIPGLMRERGLDAIAVLGGGVDNPVMTYLTGKARLMRSVFVMKADGGSLLVHSPMERDEAAPTGLPLIDFVQAGLKGFTEEEGSDAGGEARMVCHVMEKLGVKGKVALYGKVEANRLLYQAEVIRKRMKNVEVVPDADRSIFDDARLTKDAAEIEHMRDVGRRTCEAIALTRDYLFSCPIEGTRVVKREGGPLRIGDLRAMLRAELIKRGLVERSGTILSMGRDSAVPHNFGNDEAVVETGKTIIFDVFPGEIGGGYVFDITRTYCVGNVPEAVQRIYDDVLEAHRSSIAALKLDTFARVYQDKVCDFFESRGYSTIRQNDANTEGYVHGLGHGVGLEVHERPRLGGSQNNVDKLVAGTVFTIEPGLYFESKGMAVRIEDPVFARPDGKFEVLVEFPRELTGYRPA
ncbi:MAG: aminopeptidase P family protein [Candidatus Eisenbacteria bacterium]|nr:aminopeptidase P family protein [Candidatus Eisenbacteria bacterium]